MSYPLSKNYVRRTYVQRAKIEKKTRQEEWSDLLGGGRNTKKQREKISAYK
jgi:hypothetical protein